MGTPGSVEHALTLPFQRTYAPGTFQLEPGVILLGALPFVVITTLLVAGTSNAVNFTDGMDGLAPGTILVASLAMMVLCFVAGDETAARTLMFPHIAGARELTVVTGAMAGACLGFIWFNCAPAQVFMGDTGSLPLGGLLAYIAVAMTAWTQQVFLRSGVDLPLAARGRLMGGERLAWGERLGLPPWVGAPRRKGSAPPDRS